MISLGGGYPNPDTFVFDRIDVRFEDGTAAALEGGNPTAASQYGPSDAHTGLACRARRDGQRHRALIRPQDIGSTADAQSPHPAPSAPTRSPQALLPGRHGEFAQSV